MKTPAPFTLSRRTFLRLALLGGIGAGAGFIWKSTESVGFARWFHWMTRGAGTRLFSASSRIALAACSTYDDGLAASVRQAWRDARAPDLDGARIVIKPNLVDWVDPFPSYTHPRLVQVMIQLAREMGAHEVIVAEGAAFRRDVSGILQGTGYSEMLASEQVPFVDLNYDDLQPLSLNGRYTRRESLLLPRTILEADVLISMPKLKTHHWAEISASSKNLFGIVPGIKYGWPKNTLHMEGIPACMAALVDSLPKRPVAVVDGVVGMQGDGPLFGTAVPSGVIVVGTDLIAVDATCARLMGFDPAQMDYFRFAGWAGVGAVDSSKIELVGDSLEALQRRFERAPRAGG